MDSEKASPKPEVHFAGSCACNRMTYNGTEVPQSTQACHCVSCRKLSGGPYQAFAEVNATSLTFYDSQEQLRYESLPKNDIGGIAFLRLSEVAERACCASCHTPLAFRYHPIPDKTWIAMGSIDESSLRTRTVRDALKLQKHIFVSQKACWCDVEKDGLPMSERFTGDFEEALKASLGKEG